MTSRERLEKTLRFEEPDRPPHFEQIFDLTDEAFELSYPDESEFINADEIHKRMLFEKYAQVYAATAERYKWDAILVWKPASANEIQYEFIRYLKTYVGNDVLVGSYIWGGFVCIDTIKDYMEFSIKIAEEPEKIHAWARDMLSFAKQHAQKLIEAGCDIIDIASDFAFNAGPFISPEQFSEFVTPYLKELIALIKNQGVKVILHTDGNLKGILNDIIECAPDILQSIDPMAGMDIKQVKEITYKKIALMGNVQCSYLQDGPDEKIIESAKYCLDHATKGGGYIYSTSNSIFKGLPLRSYEVMLDYFWKRYGVI